MHNLCSCINDVTLPAVHHQLAKAPKGLGPPIIQSMIMAHAMAADLLHSESNAPLVTNQLYDQVFKSFQIGVPVQIMGNGLSPHAIMCEGHKEANTVKVATKAAKSLLSGPSMRVEDARIITTANIHYPTDLHVAIEKLCGFSIVVDLFHGVAHPVAVAIHTFVVRICPCLHQVGHAAGTNALTLDGVNHVLCEAQQDYFACVHTLANIAGTATHPAMPDFAVQQFLE
jgi:hypothetical protein